MKTIIDQILQWPIIVQGALGSALFWLILTVANLAVRKAVTHARGFSKKRQLQVLNAEFLRYSGIAADDPQRIILSLVALIYSATHYIVKALSMACLGLFFESFVPVFGAAGFAMALYYLSLAAIAVRDTRSGIDAQVELEALNEKINKLKSKA